MLPEKEQIIKPVLMTLRKSKDKDEVEDKWIERILDGKRAKTKRMPIYLAVNYSSRRNYFKNRNKKECKINVQDSSMLRCILTT